MNNEVNNNIDNLFESSDSVETLETNVSNQNITQSQINNSVSTTMDNQVVTNMQDNQTNQKVNFPVNPNAYHPSMNTEQSAVQIGEPIETLDEVGSDENNNSQEFQSETTSKFKKTLKGFDMSSLIILAASLLSHFLIIPHIILRLYVNTIGEFIAERAGKALLSGSTFGFTFFLYIFVIPILTILMASFSVIVFAIFNVVKKGGKTLELVGFIKKSLFYSFLASVVLLLVLQFAHTDFITPVIRIITFNGYQITMFSGLMY